jgi:hypothetical protein
MSENGAEFENSQTDTCDDRSGQLSTQRTNAKAARLERLISENRRNISDVADYTVKK